MTISGEDISRVTNLLKMRPRGMSIAAIAKELHLNRNSVAKYLDLLTASGAVEMARVGPAKLYFTAPRLPVSGMINLSSDFFIMLDADLRVLYVNNNVLEFEERTRPEVLQKRLDELSFTLVADEDIGKYLRSTARDEIFQREVEVRKGGDTFHFRVKIISTVYENGTQGTTILLSDITTEREQQNALRESEERFRGIAERSSDIIVLVDGEGHSHYISPSVKSIMGYTPEEILADPGILHLSPDERKKFSEEKTRHRQGSPLENPEMTVTRSDGSLVILEGRGTPVFIDGRYTGSQIFFRDITARKAAENALRESEARYRAVVEDQTELICRFLPDGTHVFVNEAYCRYFQKTREDLIGRRFIPRIPEEDRGKVAAHLASLIRENPVGSIEHRIIMPNGEVRWQRWVDRAIVDPQGHLVEYQSVGRDTTARRRAEDLARAQFQSFPVPTYIWRQRGADLVLSEYNGAALRFTRGMIPGHIGRTAREMYSGLPAIIGNLERCLAEKTTIDDEMRYTLVSSGEARDLLVRYAYLPPDGVLVYTIDFTDRIALQNQLQERVRELQCLYDISRIIERDSADMPAILGSSVRLLHGAFRYPDLLAARILYRGEQYATVDASAGPWQITHGISVNGVLAGTVEAWYTARPPVTEEDVFLPEEKALLGVVAERLGRIGERIDATAALQDKMHLVTELLDRIPVPVYYVDTHGVFLGANLAFEALAGVPRGKIIGRTAAMVWPDKHTSQFEVTTQQLLRNGGIRRDEMVLPMEGRESLHVVLNRAPFHGMDGTVNGIVATIQNITELKHAERALQASEEQFREMAETSPFPISIIDGNGRYRYLNRRFTDIFGYTLDEVPTGRRWFEQAFPDPDLRRETIAAWKGDLAGSQPGMVRPRQFPVRCRNGECREIIFRPVTLRDGTQYITYEDMTERLHTMDSLRQSDARFKHLFNSMRCCFTLVEPVCDAQGIPVDLTFLEVNTAMERLSGRIREDLLGQQLRELYPNTPPELIDAIGAVALTGDPKKLVIYHPDFDRHLKIRAYSPWKGQCALIFRVVAPHEAEAPPGQAPRSP